MGKRRCHQSSSSSTSNFSCSSSLKHADGQTLFAVMLAALCNREPTSEYFIIIQKTLDHLLLSLLSRSPISLLHSQNTLPIPIISLLPLLISSRCSEIACSGLEVVGAASLFSIEMNEQIALDEEIVKELITAVASSKRSSSVPACNAILDLLTTSVGRRRLLEFSAIDSLIFSFLQVPKSSAPSISLFVEDTDSKSCFRLGLMEDEFPILLLHATVTLINDCTMKQLEKIPIKFSKFLLTYLKKLWAVHKDILINGIKKYDQDGFYLSNIRTNNLAECLFRLSMKETFTREVRRSIFHSSQISFEHFILNHWETSPLLITRSSNTLSHDKFDNLFNYFSQFLRSKETISSFIVSLLQNITSALPISSDELDIISFLKEVREDIGCPIIYQQDIRVLKTLHSKQEMHFFQDSSDSKFPHFLYAHDILRCEEAYRDGYTFALRGMEFYFEDIASISEGLACLFGQPSTGVNMYLTPSNSQGLACHRDDHCVLVCQIKGVKNWKIYPNSCHRLPRLYEPVDDLVNLDEVMDGCKEFLLREGDVLYIPRGFPHEAYTVIDEGGANGNAAEYSLHLTLAIEIEPPFEWEGFAHVALHHWNQNHNLSNHISHESLSWDLNDISVRLMHIAIKLISNTDPTFRKACLVGSISYSSVSEGWLLINQKSTFSHLVNTINIKAKFSDVFSALKSAMEKHEDPFENLKWLRVDLQMSSMEIEDLFHLLVHRRDKVEGTFMDVKSRFCSVIVFEDVEKHYKMILEKYKRTRKQYLNGMLSLNCI